MNLILTPDEIRRAEAAANADGLSYAAMMEAAGRGCAAFLLRQYPEEPRFAVLVGKGKNGGDGFVIARVLAKAGRRVTVIRAFDCPSDPLSEAMREKLPDGVRVLTSPAPDALCGAGVIVDAVFGIGFAGEVPEPVRALLERANGAAAARVAIDLPSGFVFRADHTLTMLCLKPQHVMKPLCGCCGEVHVIDIGFAPPVPAKPTCTLLPETAFAALPARPFDANKGTFGNALIVAGSYRMPGAAVIAATGCLHTGAGLTTLAFPDKAYPAVTAHLTEAVLLPLPTDGDGGLHEAAIPHLQKALTKASALVIGPGLGTGDGAARVLRFLLDTASCPLVLDADGINLFAAHKLKANGEKPWILTPHPGEMARLTGKTAAEINADREGTARVFAKQTGVTLLLKGANTLVASPDGRLYVNPTGTPAMARGGSGDLLAGVIGALLAQGAEPFAAASLGAYFHGLAGNTAEARFGPYAATVSRIADALFQ